MAGSLRIPSEVEDTKNRILCMWVEIGRTLLGDSVVPHSESTDVWQSLDRLTEYLWSIWGEELSEKGFTEQKFRRLMRYRTDDVLLWVYDRIPWREFVNRIIESIEGPMGKAIAEGSHLY